MRKLSPPRDYHRPTTTTNVYMNNSSFLRQNVKKSFDNSFVQNSSLLPIYDHQPTPTHIRQDSGRQAKVQKQIANLSNIVKPTVQVGVRKEQNASRNSSMSRDNGTKKSNSRKDNLSYMADNYPVEQEFREKRNSSISQHRNNLEQVQMNREARYSQIREVYSNKGLRNTAGYHRRTNSSAAPTSNANNYRNLNTSHYMNTLNMSQMYNNQSRVPRMNNGYSNHSYNNTMLMHNINPNPAYNTSYFQDAIPQDDFLVLKDISNLHEAGNDYSSIGNQGYMNALNSSNLHIEQLGNELEENEDLLRDQMEDQPQRCVLFNEVYISLIYHALTSTRY